MSIKDSVKRLIEDKISAYGAASLFKITDTEIVGPHESLMVFRGLQNHTASSIKSLEGFNRGWFEEAQTLSQHSIDIATPTFRSPGTEMYFSWNRRFPTDPVDKLFRENADDPDFVCVEVNYWDNPWFPDDLRKDMERDRKRDHDKYDHVWAGGYERNSEARVFRNWKAEEFETPPDARFYFGADWGFAVDPTVLIRCFLIGNKLYVDFEAYRVGCEIDATPQLFASVPFSNKWPITADSARPETISFMRRNGYPRIKPAVKGKDSVDDGIEFLKSYDIIVHPRCKHTIDELTYYSWKVDPKTQEILPVLADKDNHVIDALRYALEGTRRSNYSLSQLVSETA